MASFICLRQEANNRDKYAGPIHGLADYLGLSPQTIRDKLTAGTFLIKTKRIGRLLKWDRRDVDRYLDKLPPIN